MGGPKGGGGEYVGDGWPRRVLLAEAGGLITGVGFAGAREVLSHPCPQGRCLGRNWDVSPNDAVSSCLHPPSWRVDGARTWPCVPPALLPGH